MSLVKDAIGNTFGAIEDTVKTLGNATVDIAKNAGRVVGINNKKDGMYGKVRKSKNKLRRPKTRASCKKRNMKWQKSSAKRRGSCRKKHNHL